MERKTDTQGRVSLRLNFILGDCPFPGVIFDIFPNLVIILLVSYHMIVIPALPVRRHTPPKAKRPPRRCASTSINLPRTSLRGAQRRGNPFPQKVYESTNGRGKRQDTVEKSGKGKIPIDEAEKGVYTDGTDIKKRMKNSTRGGIYHGRKG